MAVRPEAGSSRLELQSQNRERESELEMVQAFKLSKPTSPDTSSQGYTKRERENCIYRQPLVLKGMAEYCENFQTNGNSFYIVL